MKGKGVIGICQQRSVISLIKFTNDCLLEMVRAVDIVYLNFKVSNTLSLKIITEKLTNYEFSKKTVRWIDKWLNSQAQWVFISK